MSSPPLHLEMRGISKSYAGAIANREVNLAVRRGTVHALIGENGAGKSTLMNVLYGRVQPDAGTIWIDGAEVSVKSPLDAIRLGIGMVAQHTSLIPALTLFENIVLGAESRKDAHSEVLAICQKLSITLPLRSRAADVSVATQQKAEIVKALYRGARLIILDEPTAMLAAQEAEALFGLLRTFVEQGNSVILVTHKLREVREHAVDVTVLRAGRVVGSGSIDEMDDARLLALMVGSRRPVSLTGETLGGSVGPVVSDAEPLLELRGVAASGRHPLRGIDLTIRAGEIVGVAGVDGSGQTELAEAIMGLRSLRGGSILLDGKEMKSLSTAKRMVRGISWIPEDRRREGLVLSFSVAENLLLGKQRQRRFGGGRMLKTRWIDEIGRSAMERFRIKASGPSAAVESLSGGNQQKVVVARALTGEPRLLVALQPTRGLDVESTQSLIREIRTQARYGVAVLYFSLDLDELIEVSDRIAVMFNGQVVGVMSRAEADPERIGRLMMSGAT